MRLACKILTTDNLIIKNLTRQPVEISNNANPVSPQNVFACSQLTDGQFIQRMLTNSLRIDRCRRKIDCISGSNVETATNAIL